MSFNYGAYGKKSDVWKQTISDIENILSFYECPNLCKGRCCKMTSIVFSEDEYDKMLTCEEEIVRTEIIKHTIKVKNLKSKMISQGIPKKVAKTVANNVQGVPNEFDSIVCPLLDNGKCKIYDLRPNICKHYPFKSEKLGINGMVGVVPCFLGEALYFDYILMYCDIYAKYYNKESEDAIISDLMHLKKLSEQTKEYQNYLLNSEEGDITLNPPGVDKAFLRLNLLSRYLSKVNVDILQQKRDAVKHFLQTVEIINKQVKFHPKDYQELIFKINEYADPSFYIELYQDAYMIDNSDMKTIKSSK